MSEERLFDAIGVIDDEYIASAARRLGYYIAPVPRRRNRHTLRRALTGVVIAAALLLMCMLTAMAVSEPVRDAVLGFFGLEYSEVVPDAAPEPVSAPDSPAKLIGTQELGDIEARYYNLAEIETGPKYGFFFRGSEVWHEDGGEFTRLAAERFDEVLNVQGAEVRVTFEYAESGGVCALSWCEPERLWLDWSPVSRYGNAEAMPIICHVNGRHCPVLLDLTTGEYIDVLGGYAGRTLDFDSGGVAADGSGMLYRVEGSWLWYDAERGRTLDLRELSGEHVDSCAFAGDSIACWSYRGEAEDMTVHVWTIDRRTLERANLLDDTPTEDIVLCSAEGFDSPGASFALLLDGGNAAETLDLETGERRPLSGVSMQDLPAVKRMAYAGPDGTKIAIAATGTEGYHENITVIDYETGKYYSLDRENEQNIYEKWFSWYDEDSVAITGYERGEEGPEYKTGVNICYVYEFGKQEEGEK